jgi:hypothetical protein
MSLQMVKLLQIKDLSQNFLAPPRIKRVNNDVELCYDYERTDGNYGEKFILFEGVVDYSHTTEQNIQVSLIEAYNTICEIKNSVWTQKKDLSKHHYIIYFDGFGVYEFLADSFSVPEVVK